MIKFSREKVLLLYQMIIQETGGSGRIRDMRMYSTARWMAYMQPSAEKSFIRVRRRKAREWDLY
ncbi:MAG: hypothetical protein ACI4DP_01815 [Candidatus Ornithomonoglobus sp.]